MLRRHVYDFVRQPRIPASASTDLITVAPRAFKAELSCPICLDTLKETVRSKECLHRFCKECISRALRTGNKECPTCRAKLPSKRALIADPNYDAIISVISSAQGSAAERNANEVGGTAFQAAPSNGLMQSAVNRQPGQQTYDDLVVFYMRPHPSMILPSNIAPILLKHHLVRTNVDTCTIAHMEKYLRMRGTVDVFTKADRETGRNAEEIVRQTMHYISIYVRARNELIPLSRRTAAWLMKQKYTNLARARIFREKEGKGQWKERKTHLNINFLVEAVASAHFTNRVGNVSKLWNEYRRSLLKQEKDFLAVNDYVRDNCEKKNCSRQTELLLKTISSTGQSTMKVSIAYMDCMLPCIRVSKPKKPKEAYSDGSSPLSSSSSSSSSSD